MVKKPKRPELEEDEEDVSKVRGNSYPSEEDDTVYGTEIASVIMLLFFGVIAVMLFTTAYEGKKR